MSLLSASASGSSPQVIALYRDTRDHFHPPPTAPTPGEDASWPADHRDIVALVLDEIEDRVATLWGE